MSNYALEVCNLSKVFKIRKGLFTQPVMLKAVNNVSLRIRPGEVLGLVGESGCGKSTLSKMVLGLMHPDEGNVLLEGKEVDVTSSKMLSRMIQPVFQDPYSSLNPRKRIADIIRTPLKLHGIGSKAEQDIKVKKIAEQVGFPSRLLNSFPGQLSGGQRQRVAIARALILEPKILVLDEPTSALDVSVQAQILNLLQQLKEEMQLTYLFISHNLAVVEYLSDYVAVIQKGTIIESGQCEQIFRNPQQDYTKELLNSILVPSV